MTPDEIRRVADPTERLDEAIGFLARGTGALAEVRTIRDDAIADLLVAGNTQRQVAVMAGVSPGHVAHVATARKLRIVKKVERP